MAHAQAMLLCYKLPLGARDISSISLSNSPQPLRSTRHHGGKFYCRAASVSSPRPKRSEDDDSPSTSAGDRPRRIIRNRSPAEIAQGGLSEGGWKSVRRKGATEAEEPGDTLQALEGDAGALVAAAMQQLAEKEKKAALLNQRPLDVLSTMSESDSDDEAEYRRQQFTVSLGRSYRGQKPANRWLRESKLGKAQGARMKGRANGVLYVVKSTLERGGSVAEALDEFEGRTTTDSLNIVLKQLGQDVDWHAALSVFDWMQAQPFQRPDVRTYTTLLSLLGKAGRADLAERLFQSMPDQGVERNVYTYNAMIFAYTRNHRNRDALQLFDDMLSAGIAPDVFTYSSTITACVNGGLGLDRAMAMFNSMRASGIEGDLVLYSTVIRACAVEGKLPAAMEAYTDMVRRGIRANSYIITDLMRVHTKDGKWQDAEGLFWDLKEMGEKPTLQVYSALISAYGIGGEYEKALSTFYDMRTAGIEPDQRVYAALVLACAKLGDYEEASAIVQEMHNNGFEPDMRVYAGLLQAATRGGFSREADKWMQELKSCPTYVPSARLFATIIEAYGRSGRIEQAVSAYREMESLGIAPDLGCYTSMLDALGRAKRADEAKELFKNMQKAGVMPDTVAWSALIYGLAQAGHYDEVEQFFEAMKAAGCQPNEYTYTIVIDAFAKAQLHTKVYAVFDEMKEAKVKPDKGTFKRLRESARFSRLRGQWQPPRRGITNHEDGDIREGHEIVGIEIDKHDVLAQWDREDEESWRKVPTDAWKVDERSAKSELDLLLEEDWEEEEPEEEEEVDLEELLRMKMELDVDEEQEDGDEEDDDGIVNIEDL